MALEYGFLLMPNNSGGFLVSSFYDWLRFLNLVVLMMLIIVLLLHMVVQRHLLSSHRGGHSRASRISLLCVHVAFLAFV